MTLAAHWGCLMANKQPQSTATPLLTLEDDLGLMPEDSGADELVHDTLAVRKAPPEKDKREISVGASVLLATAGEDNALNVGDAVDAVGQEFVKQEVARTVSSTHPVGTKAAHVANVVSDGANYHQMKQTLNELYKTPKEKTPAWLTNFVSIQARSIENIGVAQDIIRGAISKVPKDEENKYWVTWAADAIFDDIPAMLQSFVLPTYQAQMMEYTSQYNKNFSVGDVFVDKNNWGGFKRAIASAPTVEDAKKIATSYVNFVHNNAGTLSANEWESRLMLNEALESLSLDGRDILDEVFHTADMLAFVPVAGTVASLAAKASLKGATKLLSKSGTVLKMSDNILSTIESGLRSGDKLKAKLFNTEKPTTRIKDLPLTKVDEIAARLKPEAAEKARARAAEILLSEASSKKYKEAAEKLFEGKEVRVSDLFTKKELSDIAPENVSLVARALKSARTLAKEADTPTLEEMAEASKRVRQQASPSSRDVALHTIYMFDNFMRHYANGGPRLAKGSAADVIATTEKGAGDLLRALGESKELPKGMNVQPEDIFGTLIAPKYWWSHHDPMMNPVVRDYTITEHARANARMRMTQDIEESLQNRVHDLEFVQGEGKLTARVTFGKSDGAGFSTKRSAERAAQKYFPNQPSRVVEKKSAEGESGWYVQYDDQHIYTIMDTEKQGGSFLRGKSGWAALFGKNVTQKQWLNDVENFALRDDIRAQSFAKSIIKKYADLGATAKVRVHRALKDGQENSAIWTRDDLAVKFGITKKETQDGYYAVLDLAEWDLSMSNLMARQQLMAQGFRHMIKYGPESQYTAIVKQAKKLPRGEQAMDVVTGKLVTDINEGDVVYKSFYKAEDAGGHYFVVREGGPVASAIEELPVQVVKKIKGYYGMRRWRYPYYIKKLSVKEKDLGKVIDWEKKGSVVAGARSVKEAENYLAREATGEIDDEGFVTVFSPARAADELSVNAADVDILSIMRSRNLIRGNSRKVDLIDDASDAPRLVSDVEQSVKAMVTNFGSNAGMRRYHEQLVSWINRAYGERLGMRFSMSGIPNATKRVQKDVELNKLYNEAVATLKHAQRNAGMSPSFLEPELQSLMNKVARLVNWGAVAKPRTKGAIRSRLPVGVAERLPGQAEVRTKIANTINGLDPQITALAKNLVFTFFVGTNFLRMPVLQSSMIPTYIGVRGAAKYMGKGRFAKDWMTIVLSRRKATRDLALRMDRKLVLQFEESGIADLMDDTLFAMSNIADGAIPTSGIIKDQLNNVARGARFGFDVGVMNEKISTFLISRNRWKETHGRLPNRDEEWSEVFGFAETLSLNQNQSDVLPYMRGHTGLAMQFQSHVLKTMGRLLVRETGMTRKESWSILGASLLMYGLDALKLGELVDSVESEAGVAVTPQVEEAIKQGVLGMAFNVFARTVTGEDSLIDPDAKDFGQSAFSAEMAPANFAGPSAQVLLNSVNKMVAWAIDSSEWQAPIPDVSAYEPFGFMPPIFSVAESVGGLTFETAKLMWQLSAGNIPSNFTGSQRAIAIAADFLRDIPITDELLKGWVILNKSMYMDSGGDPQVKAANAELLGTLLGVHSTSEREMGQAMDALYGQYDAPSYDSIKERTKGMAKENAEHIIKLINGLGGKDVTPQQVREFVFKHAVTMSELFQTAQARAEYFSLVVDEVLDSQQLDSDQLRNYLLGGVPTGQIYPGQNLVDWVRANDFPGNEQIALTLSNYQDIITANLTEEKE